MNLNSVNLFLLLAIIMLTLLDKHYGVAQSIRNKRQIYREQVLPHAGGKIPAHAFHTDRLALNRLQKEGIAIPDGILLEQRSNIVHPYLQRAARPTFSVQLTSDGRYTPVEGKFHPYNLPSIETTYLIPQIWRKAVKLPPRVPTLPVYRPFHLPNQLFVGSSKSYVGDFSKDTSKLVFDSSDLLQNWPPLQSTSYGWTSPSKTVTSYQTFHKTDYVTPQFSNDFNDFFKTFNSRLIRNTRDGVPTNSFVPNLLKKDE